MSKRNGENSKISTRLRTRMRTDELRLSHQPRFGDMRPKSALPLGTGLKVTRSVSRSVSRLLVLEVQTEASTRRCLLWNFAAIHLHFYAFWVGEYSKCTSWHCAFHRRVGRTRISITGNGRRWLWEFPEWSDSRDPSHAQCVCAVVGKGFLINRPASVTPT